MDGYRVSLPEVDTKVNFIMQCQAADDNKTLPYREKSIILPICKSSLEEPVY